MKHTRCKESRPIAALLFFHTISGSRARSLLRSGGQEPKETERRDRGFIKREEARVWI